MLKTTADMATNATTLLAGAVEAVTSQLRDLTITSSAGPDGEPPTAAASSTPTRAHAEGKKDTAPPPTKPATTGGSLSATVPRRQWIMGKDAFEATMPHHEGIRALWETKWKFPCSKSLYPFHDGKFEDFEPIFEYLIKVSTPFPSLSNNPPLGSLLTPYSPRTTSTTAPPQLTPKPSSASPSP